MATLALAAVGAAVGSAVLPAGLTVLGASISGATIGMQIGALGGRLIDQALFTSSGRSRVVEGPRLQSLHVTASSEGSPVPRIYGRARLGGQVIWAADIEEEASTRSAGGGGKGGGGGGGTTTSYNYYGSFAVAIAEGVLGPLGRVFADGQELDLEAVTYRFHHGTDDQEPDPLIAAHLGIDATPAYRGTAYIVFERLPLADFGNRLPQLSFEVVRGPDELAPLVRAVVMIPGSGEFVYAGEAVTRTGFAGEQIAANVHTRAARTDWVAALDQLASELPNVRHVSLAVSWFGTDLRAGQCRIRPAVELSDTETRPLTWQVAGLSRGEAAVVSKADGRPAFGGTPSDDTVVQAIRDLSARGLSVTLTPFLLMDIPDGNGLPDPWSGAGSQPAYPWRGRVTATTAAEIGAFAGGTGAADWGYRRFILHYATLAAAAGGVDAFVIGTEMRGLTTARVADGSYPFVSTLVTLADEVRAILGEATRITYAADWSEYFGHQPADGSGDVRYHLDPLWSSPAIHAVGIDAYFPLSDWRDGHEHRDAAGGALSIYDLDYLKSRLRGGEGFEWYYASDEDRTAQTRTPITDGLGKPWVFRPKDIAAWWGSRHYERTGGIESSTPTSWVPGSKPVWLMEIGCGAIDKGANQPNVFRDPKSSESALPFASSGRRDDLMQRRMLRAWLEAIDPAHDGHVPATNPVSTVYGGPMIDPARAHVYCWDARPYPAFPFDTAEWGDGEAWPTGHWLNGRLAGVPLADVAARILDDWGFPDHDTSALAGIVPGYVIDRVMSAREALQPLELAYFFDSIEVAGRVRMSARGSAPPVAVLGSDDLVESKAGAALATLIRRQDTDLPATVKVGYLSDAHDYRSAVAEARRADGATERVSQAEIPIVLAPEQAGAIAATWLHETWAARDEARFSLPPSRLAIEPGDIVTLAVGAEPRLYRVTEIGDHGTRDVTALSIDPSVYDAPLAAMRPAARRQSIGVGAPSVELIELPRLAGNEPEAALRVAAARQPWPGSIAVYRSPESAGFELAAIASRSATMGVTLDSLAAGPTSRLDHAARLRVRLESGALTSVTRLQLLGGGNAFALANGAGDWEVVQAERATLVAPRTYELSGLLRGQAGSEPAMRAELPAGQRIVLLDGAVETLDIGSDRIGLELNWRIGPASESIGDPDYVDRRFALAGRSLRPLSPVHVSGRRDGDGTLALRWTRRTRIAGDSWELAEVPLAEASEAYEVDIMSDATAGAGVKRTLRTGQPALIYQAADQIADFGTVPASLTVRIVQMSALVGRGFAAIATL